METHRHDGEAMGWYWVLVEGLTDEGGFYQAWWSRGAHPGEAMSTILDAAAADGVRSPRAALLERLVDDELPPSAKPTADPDVWQDPTRHDFGLELNFCAPEGIVAAGGPDDEHPEAIVPGHALQDDGEGLHSVTAVVEAPDLLPSYRALLETYEPFAVTWLRMAPDEDGDDRERLWVSQELRSSSALLAFLGETADDTLRNGHVGITAYLHEGATHVSIDEHRVLRVTSTDPAQRDRALPVLERLGLPPLSPLRSLEWDHHHWHTRPPGSRDRAERQAWLKALGFELWEPGGDQPSEGSGDDQPFDVDRESP